MFRRDHALPLGPVVALILRLGLRLSLVLPAALLAENPHFEATVDGAIDRGVEFLLEEVHGSAGWVPRQKYPAGYTALQIYALLKNDVSHLHPTIQDGLRLLAVQPPKKVYSVSLALMVYAAVLEQMDEDADDGGPRTFFEYSGRLAEVRAKVLAKMNSAAAWLVDARVVGKGVWSYAPAPAGTAPSIVRYDHSNSQFAVLALGTAASHEIDVPRAVWEEVADHLVAQQEARGERVDGRPAFGAPLSAVSRRGRSRKSRSRRRNSEEGLYRDPEVEVLARGWAYGVGELDSGSTFSMTAAGQSSALLAHHWLVRHRRGGTRRARTLERTIRDGYGWLTRFLEGGAAGRIDPYALYSLEKVCDLGNVTTLGRYSWYERGAAMLLGAQQSNGGWGPRGTARSRHDTALALLFLARATAMDGTKRSAVRITGAGRARRVDLSSRYYAHVPSLDTAIRLTGFFRRLRYRPDGELVRLATELVEFHDPDSSDELVRFSLTLRRSPSSRIRALGDDLLESLTGLRVIALDVYLGWITAWREVVRAGRERDLEALPGLRQRLRQSTSTPLRLKVIWALRRLVARAAIEDLLDVMDAGDLRLREAAHGAVTVLSGKDFPFHPDAPGPQRRQELLRWRIWSRESGGGKPPGDPPEKR